MDSIFRIPGHKLTIQKTVIFKLSSKILGANSISDEFILTSNVLIVMDENHEQILPVKVPRS